VPGQSSAQDANAHFPNHLNAKLSIIGVTNKSSVKPFVRIPRKNRGSACGLRMSRRVFEIAVPLRRLGLCAREPDAAKWWRNQVAIRRAISEGNALATRVGLLKPARVTQYAWTEARVLLKTAYATVTSVSPKSFPAQSKGMSSLRKRVGEAVAEIEPGFVTSLAVTHRRFARETQLPFVERVDCDAVLAEKRFRQRPCGDLTLSAEHKLQLQNIA
jgi:hypothetical protein